MVLKGAEIEQPATKKPGKSRTASAFEMVDRQAETAAVSASVRDGRLVEIAFSGFRPLPWNALYAAVKHWQRKRLTERYRAPLAAFLLRRAGDWQPHAGPVGLRVTVLQSQNLIDVENVCIKPLIDLLTKGQPGAALVDDSPAWVPWLTVSVEQRAGEPALNIEFVETRGGING